MYEYLKCFSIYLEIYSIFSKFQHFSFKIPKFKKIGVILIFPSEKRD